MQTKKALEQITDEYVSDTLGPWIIAWSGGKDSSVLLHLVIEGLKQTKRSKLTRPVIILTNDTQVESPFVTSFVDQQIENIEEFILESALPLTIKKTLPMEDNTFWVNLIGKGYPAPTRHFRWCTDRLKIRPTVSFIRDYTKENGGSVLLTGVRRSESSERAKVAKKFDGYGRLNPHGSLKGCMVFRPILEWSTDSIWEFLAENDSPWGKSYDDLISLYRDAIGGECPVVMDPDSAPSCGSSSIRFGCWTCTVVKKDKSFRGSIENTGASFEPMADFRDWLKEVSADKNRRMGIRRNGLPGLGPMNFELREEILRRVFQVQELVGISLISEEEISEIRRVWRVDQAMFDAYFRFRENDSSKGEYHEQATI